MRFVGGSCVLPPHVGGVVVQVVGAEVVIELEEGGGGGRGAAVNRTLFQCDGEKRARLYGREWV